MIKREKFVSRYASLNNLDMLKQDVVELEQYVDTELLKSTNIINMINQDQLELTDGEVVDISINNNAIHNDKSVLDNGSGRLGGDDDVEFAIWSDDITMPNNESAIETPWYNKTLNTASTGVLEVILPEHTNKNAAKLLVDKYLGPEDTDSLTDEDVSSVYGFWRKIPQYDGTLLDDPSVVELVWDLDWNRFKIKFKLY